MRDAYITSINNTPVCTQNDITNHIKHHLSSDVTTPLKIGFSTISKQALHPQLGIPQLYHDQLNVIASHLYDIKNDPQWTRTTKEKVVHKLATKMENKIFNMYNKPFGAHKIWFFLHRAPKWYKVAALKKRCHLTRRYLQKQPDWQDWKQSEAKQLNQYEAQGTFGIPCKLPKGANLLPLLWTYVIKDCGTKKARCVCNGSAKMTGSVTLAETYAGSLQQSASKILWAATALYNMITIGADASNAFAEAPPPKAPLYVTIDKAYREWYSEKYPNRDPLPDTFVLPVHGTLQGHPESARLWEKLIDKVIQELGLTPCTHEPCLYYCNDYKNTNKKILFLRQVDDFAVACQDKETAQNIIQEINSKMTISVKELGEVSRFNGIDVLQTSDFVKIYNKTYIEKCC